MSGGISQNHNYKPLFSFQDMHVSFDTKMLPGDLISNYKGKKKRSRKNRLAFVNLHFIAAHTASPNKIIIHAPTD
jgi:hypothetical protein